MSKDMDPTSVLEVGPYRVPLSLDSDVLDRRDFHTGNTLILHDADDTPWPIEDKKYDLVIATQVWEHLKRPCEAFAEVQRVSRSAILTFPYMWTSGSKSHRDIDEKRIIEITAGKGGPTAVLYYIPPGRKARATFVWGFYD